MALHNVSTSCLLHGWSHTHTQLHWIWSPLLLIVGAFLVAQPVKNPPAMRETWVRSLGWEDLLKKGKATHSSILGWRIPMDIGAWWSAVHGVEKSQTWLSTAQHRHWLARCSLGLEHLHFPSFSTQAPRDADAAHLETTLWVALLCMLLSPSSNSAQKTLIWTWLAELKGILRGYLDSSSL